MASEKLKFKNKRLSQILIIVGGLLIGGSVVILALTYFPIISEEIKYQITKPYLQLKKKMIPVNQDFGIVIPKINANAKVIPNVNPFDEKNYQWQLTKGLLILKERRFQGILAMFLSLLIQLAIGSRQINIMRFFTY
jgi:hypothetical protein